MGAVLGSEVAPADPGETSARWQSPLDALQLLQACQRKFGDSEVRLIIEAGTERKTVVALAEFESMDPATIGSATFITDQWVLRWLEGPSGQENSIEFAALPNCPVDTAILRQMIRGTRPTRS